ncbi:MAG: hypothetical protein WC661_04215 [Opitutaceae bacterium]|jgi:hypothetical protein
MKPFLTDRPRVDAPSRQLESATAPSVFTASGSATPPTPHDANQIECVREGDRITRLVVTCACGERIEIDCLYAANR